MSDLGNLLSGLLSEPESAQKLSRIASMLDGGDTESSQTAKSSLAAGLSSILGSLGSSEGGRSALPSIGGDSGLDMMGLMLKAMPLISQFSEGEGDPKVQLLYSLRPYLTGERKKRLDDAVTFIKLSRLAGPIMEIFNEQK